MNVDNIFVGDFETSTQKWLEKDDAARVWAWAVAMVSDDAPVIAKGIDIKTFMQFCFTLSKPKIFFHNLRFDGSYILDYLLKNGYKYAVEPMPMTIQTLISDVGEWYNITVNDEQGDSVEFYDSLKKLPLTVDEIGKTFSLPEQKLHIDYDEYRPIGHILTDNESKYIEHDVIIVAKALSIQFAQGLTALTLSGDALQDYKTMIGGNGAFRFLFPELPLKIDNDIRRAYRGGFVSVSEHYKNKVLNGISFDVNSLYPSVLYLKDPIREVTGAIGLPYGIPIEFEGEPKPDSEHPLFIVHIAVDFRLKPEHIASVQFKNSAYFASTEYVKDSGGIVDMYVTNYDLTLMYEQYDILSIEYINGYKFAASSNMFKNYIDKWGHIKEISTGGKRFLAKRMMNGLYGRYAMQPERSEKMPFIDKDGILNFKDTPTHTEASVYTALSVFTTSIARMFTIRSSQRFFKNWIYSDTDSMYLTGITEAEAAQIIPVDKTKLGAWKCEHHFTRGKFLRAKTYILDSVEDGVNITCAGMPANIKDGILKGKDPFSDFNFGANFAGKLMPKRYKGGVILQNSDFTLKE